MKSGVFTRFALLLGLIVVFGLSFSPSVALSADGILESGIVPKCFSADQEGVGFTGACQLCDLVELADNMIRFAVGLSVIVATLMFAYAGFLYVTAASKPDNIKTAHGVFMKVFIGLVLILLSWLIVNIIMQTLATGTVSGAWRDIECLDYPDNEGDLLVGATRLPSGIEGGDQSTDSGISHDEVREELGTGIGVDSSGNCSDRNNSNCTSLQGLPTSVILGLRALKAGCPTCEVVITGGTETGHSNHGPGVASVDIRFSAATARYAHDNASSLGITAICTTPGDFTYRISCSHPESQRHLHLQF